MDAVRVVDPGAPEAGRLTAVAKGGDVVRKRIKPDIHDLIGIARHRHPPASGARLRSGDAEVRHAARDERLDLMVTRLRDHAQRPRRDQLAQLIRIAGEPEEVVLLFNDFELDLVFRAAPADQLLGRIEALAPNTVEAAVGSLVDVTGRGACRPEALGPVAVTRVRGRPDEIILAEVKRVRQGPEDLGIPIDERPNWDPFPIGGQHIRQAILIRAGQEPRIVA